MTLRPARLTLTLAATWLAAIVTGCAADQGPTTEQKLVACRTELETVRQKNVELARELDARDKQIVTLQKLGDKRLEKLYHVTAVQLGNYTGGVNTDGKPGDDAVAVYLDPVDQDGSVIKAAGSVTIQVFDLSNDGKVLGTYRWPVDKLGQQWHGGFGVYHYSFTCPWKTAPKGNDLAVRVVFVDYLTGKTFSAQKTFTITPVPTSQPTK